MTAAVAGLAVLAAGALLVLATVSPSAQPGEVSYTHESTFDYTTPAPRGLVYPEGEVVTGEPVFLRLVDTLDFTYTHEIAPASNATTSTPTADLTGRLWFEVSDGSGWSHRRPLGPEQQATGEPLVIEEQLVVAEVRHLVDEIREEAGVSGSSERIDIIADVRAEGRLANAQFNDTLAPVLSFDVTEQRLSPRESEDEVLGTTTEDRSVTVEGAEPASIGFAGRSLQVGHARVAGLAGLGGALIALLVAAVAALRHGRLDRTAQLRLQYGSKMVEVSSVRPPASHGAVMVRDMATLAQLAELSERPILHHVDEGVHTYVVEDETTQYRYRIAPETPDVDDEGDVESDGPGDSAESANDAAFDLTERAAESPAASPTEPPPPAAPAPAPAPPMAPPQPEPTPAPQPRATELDIDGLERLFDRSSGPSAGRPVAGGPAAADVNGNEQPIDDEPTPEAPSRPRARVSDDFFGGRAWSARG